MLSMMAQLGFPDLWLNWMRVIFSSGFSSILLNGVPGKQFHCKRGVRQGDPLSPLLFVLAAELLQYVINDACQQGHLQLPLPQPSTDFPIIQYADETLMLMQAEEAQLYHLKGIIDDFALSTGLKVNFSKSPMIPINVSDARIEQLAAILGCQVGSLPFTYLGLPTGTTKPRMTDLTPMMDRVERRLSACSSLLSYTCILQMINSVITPVTTYSMCTIKLPAGVIENIDRARKQCLWRGNNQSNRGGNLVAWQKVQKPKAKGGLGILNLKLQNDALLLKQLHKFYMNSNIPWCKLIWWKYYQHKVPHAIREVGSFWWKDILRLSTIYRGIARYTIGDGSTVTFWDDLWTNDILSFKYPRLYSFAKEQRISVQKITQTEDIPEIFTLPLSEQAMEELLSMQHDIQQVNYDVGSNDVWTFLWGNNQYTSSRFYKLAFKYLQVPKTFKRVWNSKCTPRLKFFAWLVLMD